MTEKAVKNLICRACGSDVRAGALFCYACGAAVAPPIPVQTKESPTRDISEREKNGDAAQIVKQTSKKNREIETKASSEVGAIKKPDEILPDEFKSKPNIDLKAAAPRRENRTAQKKTIKVVWEEPAGAPNVWFLVVSLVLILYAVLVLMLMLSLE